MAFCGSRRCRPLVALDIETYSPDGFPSAFEDPIVNVSLAIHDGIGLRIVSLAYPPERELTLLRFLSAELAGLKGLLLTYNGTRFDLPYLGRRCALNGLGFELGRLEHLDLYWMARREIPGLASYSQSSVERALGIDRLSGHIHGGVYHEHFDKFLEDGSPDPIVYNIEDSLGCLRIFKGIVAQGGRGGSVRAAWKVLNIFKEQNTQDSYGRSLCLDPLRSPG
ncbi:MAG: ribonuclease H-like domain-containing protein [Thermoproteota archaeon]